MGAGRKIDLSTIGCLLLIQVLLGTSAVNAEKICHQCSGINCQRTSLSNTEKCQDELDVCVTIFERSMVKAQGCLQQLPVELRDKCATETTRELDDGNDAAAPATECFKCYSNMCNNIGPSGYQCLQCDSDNDKRCQSTPDELTPTECPISRANNLYCFIDDDGKHTVRGCAGSIKDQKDCLNRNGCTLCSPGEIHGCNGGRMSDNNEGGSGGSGGGGSGGNGGGSGGEGGNGGGSGGGGSGGNGGGSGGNGGGSGGGGSGGNGGGNGGGGEGGNGGNGGGSGGESGGGSGEEGGNGGGSGGNGGDGGVTAGVSGIRNSGNFANFIIASIICMALTYAR